MPTASTTRPALELPALPDHLRRAPVDEVYKNGFVAEGAELFDLAATCFEEVRRQQPLNPYVLLDLARVYFQMIEPARARAALAAAIALAGEVVDLWYEIGRAYQEGRLDEEAERCFLRARALAGDEVTPAAAVVAYYEIRGMLEQAQAALQQIKAGEAGGGLVTALRGMVELRLGNRAAAVQLLTTSLAELPPQHAYQINVRYALARALSESGQEAASLEFLRAAKARQAGLPETLRDQQAHQTVMKFRAGARKALETSDVRAAWRAEVDPSQRPLVFLLGYPRSGTTLLEQVLEAHGAICGLEETGALLQSVRRIFQRPLAPGENAWEIIDAADASGRERARAWYDEYLSRLGAPVEPSRVVLDKNPGLTGHIQIISRLFPHAKFLFLVRDPRDVCLSAYQTQVSLTPFSGNWLRWEDTVKHCVHMLDHWVALRDRLPNAYLEVRYEDLLENLPQTGRRVMEFLGLEWEPRQEQFAAHARAKKLYSPTLYEVRRELSRQPQGKWRRFDMDYSSGEPQLPALLAQYGYEPLDEKNRAARPAAAAGGFPNAEIEIDGLAACAAAAATPLRI